MIRATLGGLGVKVVVEPGRWLVGPAGVLVASVVLVKQAAPSRFVVLDAAMNDLVRPAMYDAWHGIVPLSPVDALQPVFPAEVTGPVCETGDTFARNRGLPALAPGARVAILDAGAYGAVMSSTYNARPLPPIALIDGDRWFTFDARHNQPRIGRILIARGRDAADIPMIASFGSHSLTRFTVVTEEIKEHAAIAA